MSCDHKVRLVVTRNDRDYWGWEIFVGASPIAAEASDNPFVSKRAAQAAGKVAVQRLVVRQQDERAFDRFSNLQRGTSALDRKVCFFVGRRIDQLLKAAARCHNVHLQCDLVRMAESWMKEDPGRRASAHSVGEIDGRGDPAPNVGALLVVPDPGSRMPSHET
jgi:hypothetical protein